MQRLQSWAHRRCARIVDDVSFGFINLLHTRHVLPADFIDQFHAYVNSWRQRSPEDYYSIASIPPLEVELRPGRMRFPSPLPCPFPANNHATFDLFPCSGGWKAPTMFIGHGLLSVSDIGYRMWCRRLNACGWNAVFCHLPYHYSRRIPWHWTGEFTICPHLIYSAEGLRQSVMEIRMMIDLISRHGCTLFGGWGTSYGGWIMALLGCVDPRMQRLILVEPILNIESAIWRSPAAVTMRHMLWRHSITPDDTHPHLRLCCPSRLVPLTEKQHILLLAGAFDQIAVPEEIETLHKAWPGSHYYCFPQGHVGYRLMPESFRLARELWHKEF